MELKSSSTLTTNPNGVVDIDLSDGTITLNGRNSSFFIQPGALSFGWGSSSIDPSSIDPNLAINNQAINRTVVYFDLLGKNWCSLKVSYATGTQSSRVFNINGTEVQETQNTKLDITIHVHRWPRIVATVAAGYVVFETGVVSVAPRVLPWLGEKIPVLALILV